MKGFVRDYYTACNDPEQAAKVMKCFTQKTLPLLSTLAKEYAVCDCWFASVPGAAIPNRLFLHGASSGGSLTQDVLTAPFALHTIFESFDATTPHDFAIYISGSSILLANRYLIQRQGQFHDYAQFVFDATHGNLPAYSFIEPAYDDDGKGTFANSQHPDFPVDRGEALIREIYYALTKSPDWKNTLFLITYDERGGIFDHVPPPVLTRDPRYKDLPDVQCSGSPDAFDFTRLGVRVPAVFISPCIPPNTVLNDRIYEHASVVATVRKLFCPDSRPLTWREAQAPTFDDVLTLIGSEIRTDVVQLPDPVISGLDIAATASVPVQRKPTDLTVLMAGAMQYSLQQRGLKPPGDYTGITNSAQAAEYLKMARQISEEFGATSVEGSGLRTERTQALPSSPIAMVGPSTHVARDRWTTDDTLGHFPYAYAIYRFLTDPETKPPLAVSILFKQAWPSAGGMLFFEFLALWIHFLKAKSDTERQPASISLGDFVQAPDYATNLGFVHDVVEDLRRVFRLIPSKHLPMVVFIDDLDRCSPGKIAAVVEAINLFLAGEFPECMFILGIDDEMVAAALDMAHGDVIAKLPLYARSTSIGWRFMDKFVQLPFVVPPPEEKDLKRYISSLLYQGGGRLDVSMQTRDMAARHVETSSNSPDQVVGQLSEAQELAPEQKQTLKEDVEVLKDMSENIKEFTDQNSGVREAISEHAGRYFSNPRDIKRFVNLFRFYYFLGAARSARGQQVPTIAQLCRWVVLTLKWPEVARWLRSRSAPLDGSSDTSLKGLERVGGTSKIIADWQDNMNKIFGLKLEQTGWLADEELHAFLKRDISDFKDEDRLSSCAGGGLW